MPESQVIKTQDLASALLQQLNEKKRIESEINSLKNQIKDETQGERDQIKELRKNLKSINGSLGKTQDSLTAEVRKAGSLSQVISLDEFSEE